MSLTVPSFSQFMSGQRFAVVSFGHKNRFVTKFRAKIRHLFLKCKLDFAKFTFLCEINAFLVKFIPKRDTKVFFPPSCCDVKRMLSAHGFLYAVLEIYSTEGTIYFEHGLRVRMFWASVVACVE